MPTPDPDKSFGPFEFLGSDADISDTSYANDSWTFSNLNSARNGPATSGTNMSNAPFAASDLRVFRNGVLMKEGSGNDYVFTAVVGNPFAGRIIFAYAIGDLETITIDLSPML